MNAMTDITLGKGDRAVFRLRRRPLARALGVASRWFDVRLGSPRARVLTEILSEGRPAAPLELHELPYVAADAVARDVAVRGVVELAVTVHLADDRCDDALVPKLAHAPR